MKDWVEIMKDYILKMCLAVGVLILCVCSLLSFKLFGGNQQSDEQDWNIVVEVESSESFEYEPSEPKELLVMVEPSSESSDVGAKGDLSQGTDSSVPSEVEDIPWFTVDEKQGTMYATSSVNIRELPTIDSSKLGMLSYGNEIEISGICNNGWYKVVYGGGDAYISGNYLSDSKPESVVVPAYNGFIVNGGGVSDKWLFKLEANYIKIPENVRLNFQTNGWSIICTNEKLGAKFFASDISIQAVADSSTKTIWVEAREAAMPSILHEMGHYIDWQCGHISTLSEFNSIYVAEVDTFKSIITTNSNNTASASEYFAEAYQVSLEYPDLLSQYCPLTYEFVVGCASGLSKK